MLNPNKQEHKEKDADITHQRIVALSYWLRKSYIMPKPHRAIVKKIIKDLKAGISI
jgi:hypothetical protein